MFINTYAGKVELDSIGYLVLRVSDDDDECVCPMYENVFCLNALYLIDDVAKTIGVTFGGIIDLRTSDNIVNAGVVEAAIDKYNEIHKDDNDNHISRQKITSYELYTK